MSPLVSALSCADSDGRVETASKEASGSSAAAARGQVVGDFGEVDELAREDEMARPLEIVSAILPLTYAYDALQRVSDDLLDARLVLDVAIVLAATLLALALGAATLRRQTP
jgi:hypothetical protein